LNNVRLIQGDGINELTVRSILGAFMAMGWSADNIAFGMGGALLQIVDRDTQRFAMKASSACINGEWVNVVKDPVTDPGKKSKAGRVTLWRSGGEFQSAVDQPKGWTDKGVGDFVDALVPVYWNGNLHNEITFEQVRANAKL
jgi:nicotinamide phosphoribosyltransferase